MEAERQESKGYQASFYKELDDLRHDPSGDGGTGAAGNEEQQTSTALNRKRALASDLMEQICERYNLNRAYKRVKSNKGAPGIDGMTVEDLSPWLVEHKGEVERSLLDGSCKPQPVLGVKIPKPGGGKRQLGIPTVVDRLVQQSMAQVLERILDPTFSDSSYGFRPGRSAHDALQAGAEYVAEGRVIVVDMDLEKFFDRVNHDVLMSRLARRTDDKRLLRIIRRFLEVGLMTEGVCIERHEGTPQGGPLSPLLANLLLDELDRELEKRGHCFCRYADDCNIYVYSKAAGERVMISITRLLERKLRLRVNRKKSKVALVGKVKFLGYRILPGGRLAIAPESIRRMKLRVKQITRRNRGISLEEMIDELNSYLSGWVVYYRYAACKSHLRELGRWIRRKLRCVRLNNEKGQSQSLTFCKAWVCPSGGPGPWH